MEFLAVYGAIREDFGKIYMGRNVADFDQNAWAIAHGFENGAVW